MRRDSCRLKHVVRLSNVLALHPLIPLLTLASLVQEHFYPNRTATLLLPFPLLETRVTTLVSQVAALTDAAAPPPLTTNPSPAQLLTQLLSALAAIPVSTRLLTTTKAGKVLAKLIRRASTTPPTVPSFITPRHVALATSNLTAWKTALTNLQTETLTSNNLAPTLDYLDDATLLSSTNNWHDLYDVLVSQKAKISVHTEKMRAFRDERNYKRPAIKSASHNEIRRSVFQNKALQGEEQEAIYAALRSSNTHFARLGSASRTKEQRTLNNMRASTPSSLLMNKLRRETSKAVARRGALPVSKPAAFAAPAKKTTVAVKMKQPKPNTAHIRMSVKKK